MKKRVIKKKPTVKRALRTMRRRVKPVIAPASPAYVEPVEGEVLGKLQRHPSLRLVFMGLGNASWPSDAVRVRKIYELASAHVLDHDRVFSAVRLDGAGWCYWSPIDASRVKSTMGYPIAREFRMQTVLAERPLRVKQVALGYDGLLLTRRDLDINVDPNCQLDFSLELLIDVPPLAPGGWS